MPSPARLRRPWRELATGFSLLLSGLVLSRIAISLILWLSPAVLVDWSFGGFGLAKECLLRIPALALSKDDAAVFFGGSVTRYGLSESTFTAEAGRKNLSLTPFLMGYTVATPSSQIYLARKIQAAFLASGNHARITAIELKPDALNSAFQTKYQRSIALRQALFMGPGELFRTFFEAPRKACQLIATKALGNVAPDMVAGLVRRTLFDYLLAGRSEEALKEKYELPGGLANAPKDADSDLSFDEEEVREFVEIVSDLKAVSRNTVVYIPPFDLNLYRRSEASWQTLERLKDRVQAETGVKTLDFSKAEGFESRDFVEGYHFAGAGIQKFSVLVSHAVVDAL